jgi:hypothetical protein
LDVGIDGIFDLIKKGFGAGTQIKIDRALHIVF